MTIHTIDCPSLHARLAKNDVVLIDVREPDEYRAAYIDGSVLIPMGQCHPSVMPCNPGKDIVFHCRRGGRSMRVCEAYAQAYPDRTIYNLEGGMDEWLAQGLPHKNVEGA